MKRWAILSFLMIAVIVGFTAFSNDDANDDKRLDAFLTKVENFYKNKEQTSTNWNMPNTNPESSDHNMPTGNMGKLDNETGLIYNSANGKLLDTELNIELDTVTGKIYDFNAKKEYLLSDLQAQRHRKS